MKKTNKRKLIVGKVNLVDLLKMTRERKAKQSGAGAHLTKKDKLRKRSGRAYEKARKLLKGSY